MAQARELHVRALEIARERERSTGKQGGALLPRLVFIKQKLGEDAIGGGASQIVPETLSEEPSGTIALGMPSGGSAGANGEADQVGGIEFGLAAVGASDHDASQGVP
jgi:hypothetical protein